MSGDIGEKGAYNEADDPERVYILEIGPGSSPATEFFNLFSNPLQVIFVSLEKDKRFPENEIPGAIFVEKDIMDYVNGDPSIPPGGFDYVIACNVISGAKEKITDIPSLMVGLSNIIKPGGTLILEETLEKRPRSEIKILSEIFDALGFDVSVTTEKSDYLRPKLWHADSFHIEATKE